MTARDELAAALRTANWREPGRALADQSSHEDHRYDYACALCRPDLDDGYERIVDVLLAALGSGVVGRVATDTLREHAIYDSLTHGSDDVPPYLWCVCGWRSDEPREVHPRQARSDAAAHQWGCVVAALREGQA